MSKFDLLKGLKAVLLLLVFSSIFGCTKKTTGIACVKIEVCDSVSSVASITGKNDFWRFNSFSRVDKKRLITFKRELEAPELFHISMNKSYNSIACFLEKGDTIEIKYHHQMYEILGTSMAAKQNRLLQNIDEVRKLDCAKRKLLSHYQQMKSKDSVYAWVAQKIKQFAADHPDCSPNFIRFLNVDNRYFQWQDSLRITPGTSKTYHPFSQSEQDLLASAVNEPHDEVAILSSYFRNVLFAYLDFLRINDPKKLIGNGEEFILNEFRLSHYLPNNSLRDYAVAKNLVELMPYCTLDAQSERLLRKQSDAWSNIIQSERKQQSISPSKGTVTLPFEPNISGIDKEFQRFQLNTLKHKWVLLYFWSTKCTDSKKELFYLQQIRKRFSSSKLEILGVSVDKIEYLPEWKSEVSERKDVGIQIFSDNYESLLNQFGIDQMPFFSIISPDGKVVYNNIPRPSSGMSHKLLMDLTQHN